MQLLAPRLYYNLKVRSGLDVRQPPGPDTKQFAEEFICALEGDDDHFEVDVECTTMDLEGRNKTLIDNLDEIQQATGCQVHFVTAYDGLNVYKLVDNYEQRQKAQSAIYTSSHSAERRS